MEENSVTDIIVLDGIIEARLLEAILKQKGIEHDILSYHDTAYDGVFQMQKGWGVVRARESDKEDILIIMADIRDQAAIIEIDEDSDDFDENQT